MKLHLLTLILILSSCSGDPIGTPCKRTGDGFTARHNCATKCLSIWRITCPDGTLGNSNVCAGEEGCSRGSCSEDQVCYQTNMDRAYCVPQTICPQWSNPALHPEVHIRTLGSSSNTTRVTADAIDISPEPS